MAETQAEYAKIQNREQRKVEAWWSPLAAFRRRQRLNELVRQYASLRHPGELLAIKRQFSEFINELASVTVVYEHSPAENVRVMDAWMEMGRPAVLARAERPKDDPRLEFVVIDIKSGKPVARERYKISRDWKALGERTEVLETPKAWEADPWDAYWG